MDNTVIMPPAPTSLPGPMMMDPMAGGIGGGFQNLHGDPNLADLPVFRPADPAPVSPVEARRQTTLESSSKVEALDQKVQNLESSLSRIEQLLVASLGGSKPQESPAPPPTPTPAPVQVTPTTPEIQQPTIPTPLIESPVVEALSEAPLVELPPLEEGQLRVHIPQKPTVYLAPEAIVEGWVDAIEAYLPRLSKQRGAWRAYRDVASVSGNYPADRWPAEMQVHTQELFEQLVHMPALQRGVIRGLLMTAPGNVTIERIVKVLVHVAGTMAWAEYCTTLGVDT